MFQIMHHPYVDLKIACYENSRHRNIAIETFGNEYALIFLHLTFMKTKYEVVGGPFSWHCTETYFFYSGRTWNGKKIFAIILPSAGGTFLPISRYLTKAVILKEPFFKNQWWFCGIDAFFAITSFASIEKEASFLLCICYLHLGILLYSWCYMKVAKIP